MEFPNSMFWHVQQREPKPPRKHWYLPGTAPLVTLILGLAATVLATLSVWRVSQSKDLARFESEVRWTQHLIQERVNIYVGLLRGGAALFAADPDPSRKAFQSYVERLKLRQHYPGIQGFGFAKRVLPADVDRLVQRMRAEGEPEFVIRPAGERPEYFPIIYLFPKDRRNQNAIGYDMFSEPVRQQAMAEARDTGIRAASGKVVLVQEIDTNAVQAGFLIYLPVYEGGAKPATLKERQQKLIGFVYSPFRADDLFAGIFATETERPSLHFEVYDGAGESREQLLHRSPVPPSSRPAFTKFESLNAAGRLWTLRLDTTPNFEAGSSMALVPWVFGVGLLLSLVLFGINSALARTQRQLQSAQGELKAHAELLERTVAERTARLRETVAELEYMSYSITHDMRAPLRAIQSFAGMLQEEAGPRLNEEMRNYLSRMRSAATRMDALIRDVLNYGKLVREELPMQPMSVPALVRGIVDTYPMLHSDNAQVEVKPDIPPVLANEAALTQCLSNLLGNAVKFVRPGHKARVQVDGRQIDGFVRISVQDNGIGIPHELQGKIFGMFQRLSHAYEGTGMGLAIVRKAAERMGGRVGVDSEPGQGSCFWIDLKPAAAQGSQPE